MEDSFFR